MRARHLVTLMIALAMLLSLAVPAPVLATEGGEAEPDPNLGRSSRSEASCTLYFEADWIEAYAVISYGEGNESETVKMDGSSGRFWCSVPANALSLYFNVGNDDTRTEVIETIEDGAIWKLTGEYDGYVYLLSLQVVQLTFMSDGEEICTVFINRGSIMPESERPEDPTKEGFVFAGWSLDGEEALDLSAVPFEADVVLYALWREGGEDPDPGGGGTEPDPDPDIVLIENGTECMSATIKNGCFQNATEPVTVSGKIGSVTFNEDAAQALANEGTLALTVEKESADENSAIYRIELRNGSDQPVFTDEVGSAAATITLTYEIPEGYQPKVYLIADSDKYEIAIDGCTSDSVTFQVFHFSEYEITVELSDDPPVGGVTYSATLTLRESIDINFYVNGVDPADAGKYTVYYHYEDEPAGGKSVTLQSLTPTEQGQYVIRVGTIHPYQMWRKVLISVYYDGEQVGDPIEYSASTYFHNTIERYEAEGGYEYAALVKLCKAALVYGSCAQVYFYGRQYREGNGAMTVYDTHVDRLVNDKGFTIDPDRPTDEYTAAVSGSIEGVALDAASLIMGTETSIKIYLTGNTSNVRVTCVDNRETSRKVSELQGEADGRTSFKITGIKSYELSRIYIITIADESDETQAVTLTYSPYTYARSVWDRGDAFADLCQALVAYGDAANAYWMGY